MTSAAAAVDVPDMDVVGGFMTVKLTNGVQYEGTIFAFEPEAGLLVLMEGTQRAQPTLRMVRVPFIESFTFEQSVKKEQQLPAALGAYEPLPSLRTGKAGLLKQVTTHLKAAQAKRAQRLSALPPDTPIAAVDAWFRVENVYPTAAWDAGRGVITVNEVFVEPATPGDWSQPRARAADEKDERARELVERVQNLLDGRK